MPRMLTAAITTITCIAWVGTAAAQDSALAALHVQKSQLRAQIEDLRKIITYQQNLLALAREDPQAAQDARRTMQACTQRDGAGALCPNLSTSYAVGAQ